MIYPDPDHSETYTSIILANLQRDKETLGPCATANRAGRRRDRNEKIRDSHNIRPAFSRDCDRILHCNAYARYIDKTQVFFLTKNDHISPTRRSRQ